MRCLGQHTEACCKASAPENCSRRISTEYGTPAAIKHEEQNRESGYFTRRWYRDQSQKALDKLRYSLVSGFRIDYFLSKVVWREKGDGLLFSVAISGDRGCSCRESRSGSRPFCLSSRKSREWSRDYLYRGRSSRSNSLIASLVQTVRNTTLLRWVFHLCETNARRRRSRLVV